MSDFIIRTVGNNYKVPSEVFCVCKQWRKKGYMRCTHTVSDERGA